MPQPFIKFFPADWEADAQLMSCSLAARGLWLHMMRVMHEADPYGFFVGRSGETVDLIAFAHRINAKPQEVRRCMTELEKEGVFSRDDDGRIFCRRMVRTRAKSLAASEWGKDGGSPLLTGSKDNGSLKGAALSQDLKGRDNASCARVPEAQKLRDTDSLRSSAIGFAVWPEDIEVLRGLALIFIAGFANCHDLLKAQKHIPPYTAFLAEVRERYTIAQVWKACEDALKACSGKPLFGASIKMAKSFLPGRVAQKYGNGSSSQIKPFTAEDRV